MKVLQGGINNMPKKRTRRKKVEKADIKVESTPSASAEPTAFSSGLAVAVTPSQPEAPITPREQLLKDLESLEAKIIEQMPTKYELAKGNSKTVDKIIRFDTEFQPLVTAWRALKAKLGIKKTLDSMRPSGITIAPGQNVGRITE